MLMAFVKEIRFAVSKQWVTLQSKLPTAFIFVSFSFPPECYKVQVVKTPVAV